MKPYLEKEFEEYQKYITKYFSELSVNEIIYIKEFRELFNEVLLTIKIIERLPATQNIETYYELIIYNLSNVLYFLPLNETVSINISIRNATESLLRLVYTLNNPGINYSHTGYRNLKDSKDELQMYNRYKPNIDTLFSIYARRSNKLHLKNAKDIKLITVLESRLSNGIEKKKLKEITQDIEKCKLTLLETIVFYEIKLSTAQKISLGNFLTNRWKNKINELL